MDDDAKEETKDPDALDEEEETTGLEVATMLDARDDAPDEDDNDDDNDNDDDGDDDETMDVPALEADDADVAAALLDNTV